MRYFASISYKGSMFHGWQSQKSGVKTIQEEMEQALFQIGREKLPVTGCGRTDAGVHATEFYFHFDSTNDWLHREYQLNAILDQDIAVHRIIKVPATSHARYDAVNRTYWFRLHCYKDPFLRGLSFHFKENIDLDLMNQAASILLQYEDFSTFCKSGTDVERKLCKISEAIWEQGAFDGQYIFRISSNRFLRGMVRLIVGMCLHVANERISLEMVEKSLANRRPLQKAWSVPADGLYLHRVDYPYNDLLRKGNH